MCRREAGYLTQTRVHNARTRRCGCDGEMNSNRSKGEQRNVVRMETGDRCLTVKLKEMVEEQEADVKIKNRLIN